MIQIFSEIELNNSLDSPAGPSSVGLRECVIMVLVNALNYNLIWEPFLVTNPAKSSLRISQTQLTGIIQIFQIQ